ncbi:MAG: site-2 protease family protein [Candidatus Hodarchaeaceae archaeon]|nr:site-2 protease family protein [Candidatus Hodarchaeaceae archaeon]
MEKDPPARKFECLNCKYSDYRMSALEIGEIIPGECPRCGKDMKVVGMEPPDWLAKPLGLVSKHFDITDFVASSDRIELEVTARNPKQSFRALLRASKQREYLPVMRGRGGELRLMLVKTPPVKAGNVAINFLLLAATFLTTFAAGYFILFGGHALQAALFSGAIMLMLGAHELGHKIAAWRNGVESTLPYFIPAPNFLGTFGAVISIKSPIPTKEALVEMGAAGPLLGFAVALPLTFIGLTLSKPDPTGLVLPITPAIFAILQVGVFGHVPSGLSLNPLAFAGWVVMVLTMFNLIPAGQLDGGHVARGVMSRERHFTLTRTLGFALFLTGLPFPDFPLWIWGFLIILLFRGYHAGALDDVSKLSGRQKKLAVAALVVFLLCLPVPVG